MNEKIKKFTYRFDSFFYGVFITALLVCVFSWACNEYYFGKSEEEISKENDDLKKRMEALENN